MCIRIYVDVHVTFNFIMTCSQGHKNLYFILDYLYLCYALLLTNWIYCFWIICQSVYLSALLYPPYECMYRGYYGLVVIRPCPPPRPQTFHRSPDNLKNPYRIASIFYM